MTTTLGPVSTKEQIVLAAERLFAQHGYEGVSLREIGAAAGSSNNSAVQYHFGSKAQLVVAIFEHRMPHIDERRGLLLAQLEPTDVRSWVECYVLPLLEQSEIDGSNYMSFIAALEQQEEIFAQLPDRYRNRTETFFREVERLLHGVPGPLRTQRIHQVVMFGVREASFRERARTRGFPVLPFRVFVSDLLNCLAGFLEAPVSPGSRGPIKGGPTLAHARPFVP